MISGICNMNVLLFHTHYVNIMSFCTTDVGGGRGERGTQFLVILRYILNLLCICVLY